MSACEGVMREKDLHMAAGRKRTLGCWTRGRSSDKEGQTRERPESEWEGEEMNIVEEGSMPPSEKGQAHRGVRKQNTVEDDAVEVVVAAVLGVEMQGVKVEVKVEEEVEKMEVKGAMMVLEWSWSAAVV